MSAARPGGTALMAGAIAATHPAAPDSAVATSLPSLTHHCTVVSEQTIYVAALPHLETSLRIASGWVQCILATYTPSGHAVQKVHLGVYELVANLVDHGRPLKAGARIEIGLQLEPGAISGWIADQCHAFDPRVALAHSQRHRLDAHQPRGYGLYLVQQLFDSIDHHFGADGNRVEFRKDTRA